MANLIFIVISLTILYIPRSRQTPQEDASSLSATTPASTLAPITNEQNQLAHAVNDLGYELTLKLMKKNENKNVVISPTSVAGLLAMTLLGTVGDAYNELADVLRFSQDILMNRKNHEQFGLLLQQLNTNDSSRTIYSNAIIVDGQVQVRKVYQDYLQHVYRGETLNTNFKDPEKSTELINEWVKNNTNGKLEQFIKQPLSTLTKAVLLSALYFSGQWAQPFIPELTRPMVFKKPSDNVTTDFMVNTGYFNYVYNYEYGFHIIALPYNDSITTMYALVPHSKSRAYVKDNMKELSLLQLMENLNYSKIDDVINTMNKSNCVISFPKMELKSEFNLVECLQDMGVKSIFSATDANFALMIKDDKTVNKTEDELITRINSRDEESSGLKEQLNRLPNPGVFINKVLHNVKMAVNEFGTEAAAASSAFISRTANLFYADSPFYLFIRNERTKLVTFSAAIFDPTAYNEGH
ncbi:serpin B8-like [Hyposmocoma kahamanoa]|uniref:serpin B8-like n=1 Tax=Hyposmocoma kahamanoa TaxID=1477025 RepID=UPI000E6D6AF1|nr:serpin B8-like [Hyposmocoma kahamanoa]